MTEPAAAPAVENVALVAARAVFAGLAERVATLQHPDMAGNGA